MSKINNWLSVDKAKGEGDAIITLTASTYEEMYERLSNLIVKGKTKNIDVLVKQRPSFKRKYFWVEFEEPNKTVTLKDITFASTTFFITMKYSFDGINWKSVTRPYENYFSFSIEMGDNKIIYFKNESKRMGNDYWGGYCFYFNGYCKIGGDATALTDMVSFALCRTFADNPYLTDASELSLPWDTLSKACFCSMFTNCTSLIAPPKLPATVLAERCYNDMFSNCINMEYAPILSAPILVDMCYGLMFGKCKKLKHIEMYATDITAELCLAGWVGNYSIYSMGEATGSLTWKVDVAEEGVFYKNPNTDIPLNSYDGIPTNWKVIGLAEPLEELNKKYLWIELEEDGEITGLTDYSKYSYDGSEWTTCTSPLSVEGNRRIYIKSTVFSSNDQTIGFTANGKIGGDLSSFRRGNCDELFKGNVYLTDASELILPWEDLSISSGKSFGSMFEGCTSLVNGPLVLPATTLGSFCYQHMFEGCTSLVNVPKLPATTLVYNCYYSMFNGCTSLVSAPELPATTLDSDCYNSMFRYCTSLVNAPDLPATTLENSCYEDMFNGCTSLVTAPELPATTLAKYCYRHMFDGCTSLVNGPSILPATTLAEYCYNYMFNGCTSLVTTPKLPATTLKSYCYAGMFDGCTSLVTAPELPATVLKENCYYNMFYGCSNLNYIKMLATDISAESCLKNWVYKVSSTGTFVKHPNANIPIGNNSGIPEGWTVETATE